MNQVKILARAHCLGVLVLDELQNVSVRKSGGREELLNWFQELVNELKLPLVILGTFKAQSVLRLDTRHSRRAALMGSATWRPLKMDVEFRLLVAKLWECQWLRRPGKLTEEFLEVVFAETQGVVAFVVDMFLVCQLQALSRGQETLTPKMFKDVARTEFEFLQPLLVAVRSKDPARLAKFEDFEAYDIDQLIAKQQNLIPQGTENLEVSGPEFTITSQAAQSVMRVLNLEIADVTCSPPAVPT